MRLPTALTSAASAAAAVLLLTACGGGDSDDTAASGSSDSPSASDSSAGASSSDAPTSSAPAEGAAEGDPQTFCTDAITAGNELDQTFTAAGSDTTQVPALLQQVQTRFAAVTPPAAVADDWNALLASVGRLSDSAAGIDFAGDPNAFDTFSQVLATEEAPYTEAENGVLDYIRTECGLDPGTGEPLSS